MSDDADAAVGADSGSEAPNGPPSPRQQAAAKTKAEILETARRLFSDQGYKSTSISDIAKATGLAPGTIYVHFKSKEDLLVQVIRSTKPTELPILTADDVDVEAMPREALFATIASLALDQTEQQVGLMTAIAQDARKLPATKKEFYEQTLLGPMRELTQLLASLPETAEMSEEERRICAHAILASAVFLVLEQKVLGGNEVDPIDLGHAHEVLGRIFAGGIGA